MNVTPSPLYRQLVDSPTAAAMFLNVTPHSPHSHYNWSRHPDMDLIEDPAVQAFFFICYTTIFVLGVFGNVLVCYVVGRNRAMQTVTNFFITNLALSDILLCILAVPFTPLYSFLGQWIFGRVLCHLVAYAQGTSVYISTLTLTSIAIDRFFVIIYPFHVSIIEGVHTHPSSLVRRHGLRRAASQPASQPARDTVGSHPTVRIACAPRAFTSC
jgi:hypothetical protein